PQRNSYAAVIRWISAASATGSRPAITSRQYQRPGRRGTAAVTGCSSSGSATIAAGIAPKTPGSAAGPASADLVVGTRGVGVGVAVISHHIFPWTFASIHRTTLRSRGLRVMVMRLSGAGNFWTVRALGRENSRRPSAPWMRPKPDAPEPPKGNDGMPAKARNALTDTMPVSSFSARARPRRRSLVKIEPPSPYEPALALST